MTGSRFSLNAIFVLVACISLLPMQSTKGQESPTLTEDQQSVIMFDLRLDRLLEGAKSIGTDPEQFDQTPVGEMSMLSGIKLTEFKRVFGSASLPKSLAAAMQIAPGNDLPIEFFVRVQLANAKACDTLEETIKSQSEMVEFAGKKYLSPTDGAFTNLVAHRVNETTFEFGTKNYCAQPKRRLMTPGLDKAFTAAPVEAVRIALDLETPSELLNEAVAMGKQNGGPQVEAYLDLIDNMKSLIISFDLTGDNLLTIIGEGKNDDEAEEFKSGVDSLLGVAKLGGQMALGQVQDMPEATDIGKKILDSLNATREGTSVRVVVPKPEGFAEAVMKLQSFAKAQAEQTIRMNNVRQLALSVHNYESANRTFPFATIAADGQESKLSWRVQVLPFVEENETYEKLDLNKGPGESPNDTMANQMPELFGKDGKNANYSWINSGKPLSGFGDIRDGSSNTIMLIEIPAGKPWLEKNDLTIDEAVALVAGLKDGEKLIVGFYDGHVQEISSSVDKETLRNLFDPADGNVIEGLDF